MTPPAMSSTPGGAHFSKDKHPVETRAWSSDDAFDVEPVLRAAISNGPVFRAINKIGRALGDGMSPKVVWDAVRAAAARAGIDKLAPHDLRRTCARLSLGRW